MSLTIGSLFAGIGGFDLGLERAGMTTRWQVEIEPFARHILNKHWPDVPCYEDIRDVRGEEVEAVDVICGGFPCQDISNAGTRAGIEGSRSSLWKEYARLVDEIRPRYVIVENVAVLRRRGLDVVLGDLSSLGYDAEWDCLRASDFGAPHRRDRLWLVAYTNGDDGRSRRAWRPAAGGARQPESFGALHVADARVFRCDWDESQQGVRRPSTERSEAVDHAEHSSPSPGRAHDYWAVEPNVGRVAHGVPARVDRLRSLGNALVPQIAEWIGRRIVEYEAGVRPVVEPDQARVA